MSRMRDEVFQDCLEVWEVSTGNKAFWQDLADKYEYSTAEALRSAFKRERKARGISKTQGRTLQQTPVIGVMDLETLPMKIQGYTFGIREQYITYSMVARDSHMLSWAGKFLGDSQVFSDVMTPKEAAEYNSYRVTTSARKFISRCDFIIGHNWKGFDGKVLNSELMFHRILPVDYRTIDTLALIRANFREPSYKLADINKKYGIRDKISNEGMALWVKCAQGNPKALGEMLHYNEGDILATEDLFWRISPYVSGLPNFDAYREEHNNVCICGSTSFVKKGYWYTNKAKYQRLVCSDCGKFYHGAKNVLSREKRDSMIVSV